MFRPPTKYSEYLQDVLKSIDHILKMLRKPKVDKIIAGTYISVSPASGTGDVTVSVNTSLLHAGGLYSQTQQSVPVTTSGSLIDGGVGTLTIPANTFLADDIVNIKVIN